MRKTEATIHARIESNHYKVLVELWSRAHIANGITYPRVARNWVRLSHRDKTDQEVLDAQRELQERGFRHERTVDLKEWEAPGEPKKKRPRRPRTPQWKVFDAEGLYMGSLHEPTDAAFVISNYPRGAQVRYGREVEDAVWTEVSDGCAGDSFDGAVEKMLERLDEIRARRSKAAEEAAARTRRARS